MVGEAQGLLLGDVGDLRDIKYRNGTSFPRVAMLII